MSLFLHKSSPDKARTLEIETNLIKLNLPLHSLELLLPYRPLPGAVRNDVVFTGN